MCLALNLWVLGWVLTVGGFLLSFLGGYLYRQHVISTGELPRVKNFWLVDDVRSGETAD